MPSVYDCLIVGGGPAGLTAAIYLARFNRTVAVIDRLNGRWNTFELNENYFGFPEGIHTRQLVQLGLQQARRFGVDVIHDEVADARQEAHTFSLHSDSKAYHSKSIIFATGVMDLQPPVVNYEEYWGKSLFWCITCDGYRSRNKKIIVLGDTGEAACTALQFMNYTPDITFVTNVEPGRSKLPLHWREKLQLGQVPVVEGRVTQFHGTAGQLTGVTIEHTQYLEAEMIFNQQGAVPNSNLATRLGVKTDPKGYIIIDTEQRTNIPFVYAAGDVTTLFAHQIASAVHEGSMAGQAANYDLYLPIQKSE